MRGEGAQRGKNTAPVAGPVWLRLEPVFDAGWFWAAGFSPQDLPVRNWPALWDRWLSAARAGLLPLPSRTLLLAELPACVEEETDAQFRASPFLGYAHDLLAQALCRDLARAVLKRSASGGRPCLALRAAPAPDGAKEGRPPEPVRKEIVPGESLACLPFPRLSPDERAALVRLGILAPKGSFPLLLRRYALLTIRPPTGGCAVCALAQDCPKRPFSS